MGTASHLKLVCVSATGTNNLDQEFLERRGIAWRNVAGYSTENVAQHTFALLFALLEKLSYYDDYVKSGKYTESGMFTHFSKIFHELHGMTWGIIGLGCDRTPGGGHCEGFWLPGDLLFHVRKIIRKRDTNGRTWIHY